MFTLTFESKLTKSREEIWTWITSTKGISAEMWPLLRMTFPKHNHNLVDIEVIPGARLFRSYLFLFTVLPIDFLDLTLLELRDKQGFVEQSTMGLIKSWRHERFIESRSSENEDLFIVDRLSFEPRFGGVIVKWIIKILFKHRHKVLRKNLC